MIISASQFWYAKVNQACLSKFVFPTYEINAKTALFSHRYCIKSLLHILIHHHIEIISRNSFRLTSISPSFANRLDLFFIHKSIRQIRTTWCGFNCTQGYWHCPTALLLLFFSLCKHSARETWHSYYRHLLLHNNWLSLHEMWLSPFSIWRCYVTKGLYWEKRQETFQPKFC